MKTIKKVKIKRTYQHAFQQLKHLGPARTEKLQKLPFWLNYSAWQFKKEKSGQLPKKYYHFKRGAIIRVNFGVNPGSEFSFTHFAVVLDKNDTSAKRTLTVLPLTSSYRSDRFPLGRDVFAQTVFILNRQIKQLKAEIINYRRKLRHMKHVNKHKLRKNKHRMERQYNELKQVIKVYKACDKKTYVRVDGITTISKLRLKRINRYDPSGKIHLNKRQMRQLSKIVAQRYLNNI